MKIAKTLPDTMLSSSLIDAFASNRSTLVLLVVLALSITLYYQVSLPQRIWIIALPTALLILNFLLALATRDILKNKWQLMIFHFAKFALVFLAFA